MSALLVVLVAVPAVSALVSLFARRALIAETVTAASGVICFASVLALAAEVRNGASVSAAGDWLHLDALGAVFLLATAFLYATGSFFSIGYLRAGERRATFQPFARRYYAYLNLFGLAMLLVPLMNDFAMLWVAVELTTIVSVVLVALERTDGALEAAWKYVLVASVGLGIALLAVVLLYAAGVPALGAGYLPRFAHYLAVAHRLPKVQVEFAFILAVVGFGTKVGFAPMHTWLPDAHSEAPSPVSALLSGALLANAFYAILRFFEVTRLAAGDAFPRDVLLVFGTISLLVAALFVLRQENYKRLLAYSTIEHMGVIAIGIGFGAPIAVAGALFHVINHSAAKGLAFFGSGSILRRYDTKEIDRVRGAATVLPWSGPMFLLAALALSAFPVSGVFRSEFQIVSGGFASGSYTWVALLLVLVNVAFFGIVWHVGRIVLTPARDAGAAVARGETSWWMVAAMLACTVVVVGLGFYLPGGLAALLEHAAHTVGARG
ncbi:MAG TPA: proton-conducting transporter membrane subunit [Gaiellaceae bacterium]|nr:proton-conducting transporter membrane subunit [Gaiellaceae bacterium]